MQGNGFEDPHSYGNPRNDFAHHVEDRCVGAEKCSQTCNPLLGQHDCKRGGKQSDSNAIRRSEHPAARKGHQTGSGGRKCNARMRRLWGKRGQRIGEAAHPGPTWIRGGDRWIHQDLTISDPAPPSVRQDMHGHRLPDAGGDRSLQDVDLTELFNSDDEGLVHPPSPYPDGIAHQSDEDMSPPPAPPRESVIEGRIVRMAGVIHLPYLWSLVQTKKKKM